MHQRRSLLHDFASAGTMAALGVQRGLVGVPFITPDGQLVWCLRFKELRFSWIGQRPARDAPEVPEFDTPDGSIFGVRFTCCNACSDRWQVLLILYVMASRQTPSFSNRPILMTAEAGHCTRCTSLRGQLV
eukprot:1178357-Amphidinium_carterae.1